MSHIVSIKTKVHDPAAVSAACARLGLPVPRQGTTQLFSGEVSGLLVQFPNWQYPIVLNTETGDIHYDNYEGAWGDQQQLNKFLQMYAVEKAKLEARKKGYQVSEQALQDGSIKLQIVEGS